MQLIDCKKEKKKQENLLKGKNKTLEEFKNLVQTMKDEDLVKKIKNKQLFVKVFGKEPTSNYDRKVILHLYFSKYQLL